MDDRCPRCQPAARGRLAVLDTLRGLILLNMIAYHAIWDAVYLFGAKLSWFSGPGALAWQQFICFVFIFLSGFCWPLGSHPVRRGLTVAGAGALVTVSTLLFTPESRIVFGILTFLGSSMLLQTALHPLLRRVPAGFGLAFSLGAFVLLRQVNTGVLSVGGWVLAKLPALLYRGSFATYLGFMDPTFFSTDYFSLLPWYFLFLVGYFCHGLAQPWLRGNCPALHLRLRPVTFLGRHSLWVYLLHQPALYLAFFAADHAAAFL